MILTGHQILKEIKKGNIGITPFNKSQLNPNSYNYRLGNTIKVFRYFDSKAHFTEIKLSSKGFVLQPKIMYLANTLERIGSQKFAMSLIGKSSIGRLGLFLQISANLGHTTSNHNWTLELVCAKPFKIYPGMIIGQISFWQNKGITMPYLGKYTLFNTPQESI